MTALLSPSDAYSIGIYCEMIADRARMGAYRRALEHCVKRESVVLDIGTGIGIFAFLAHQLGARRIIAVEPDDVIEVAREIAVASGLAGRIEFVQGLSTTLELEEPADVIVSDLRGTLPLYRLHIPSLIDARTRLLAPKGVLIPMRDTVWIAVVEGDAPYRRHLEVWRDLDYGVEMEAARRIAANTWWTRRVEPKELLSTPVKWATLDYRDIDDPSIASTVECIVTERRTAHGFAVWFDAELVSGVSFSGAPGQPDLIYSHAFFPFPEPVEVAEGDAVIIDLRADLVGSEYAWRWDTIIRPDAVQSVQFQQTSVLGAPLSRSTIDRARATHVPTLSEEGRALSFALSRMSGAALEQIAEELLQEFPERFESWAAALEYVGQLSSKYSE